MQALNDMKKRFQGLIETYEQSNTELEDELKIKIGHSSALQIENEELSSQLSSVQHSLHRVTGECSTYKQQAYSRQQAVLHLKQVIGRLESKIKIEVAQIKRTSLDVSELMKLLIHNTASESSKAKALVADAVKSAFLSIDGDRLIAVQEVQRALIKEHRQHEEAMSQAFTTEMWKKTAEYSETIERTKSELISHFDQAMMFGQYEDKSGFHSSLSTSERAHFALVLSIKAILDSLVSVSLIDADFVNEVMQLISSNSTVDGESDFNSISAGLLATKLHKILKIKLDESLQLRDTDGAVSSSLKNEVNSLRIQVDKGNNQIRELTKENASLTSQVGSTLTTLTKLNKDITTIKELHAIETETLSQEMRDKLYSAQREYDNSIQNLRIDFIQKEADLKLRLDEAHSSVRSTNETTFLEARLKSEVTKRQSLANRLSAEEAAHRSIVQELEDRNMQLLRKVEALELDMTKLKLEKLHQFGEEFMASTIMHVNHTTTASSNTNNSNIISSSSSNR